VVQNKAGIGIRTIKKNGSGIKKLVQNKARIMIRTVKINGFGINKIKKLVQNKVRIGIRTINKTDPELSVRIRNSVILYWVIRICE
jgi:hypothetical protein